MALIINVINLIVILFLRGSLFILCWNWFVQEVFDVPDVNLPEALGLSLFVSFLVYQFSTTPLDELEGECIRDGYCVVDHVRFLVRYGGNY
jgi:hypothetical protein